MVSTYDGCRWERWYPVGPPASEPLDANHFNSVFGDGEDLVVVAHNLGTSDILRFRLPDLTLVEQLPLGVQAHNVWRVGEEIYTCSSAEGSIRGSKGFELSTGGFPRGVAITEDRYYVGISELSERNQRDFTSSEIQIYDRSWKLERKLFLRDEGMVLELRAAGTEDLGLPGRIDVSVPDSAAETLECA